MSLQVDGNASLSDQQLQLQAVETFFVEVVDFQAGGNTKNDVTTKPVLAPVSTAIQLKPIATSADLAQIAAGAKTVVFDRTVYVLGHTQRVVGYR